MKKLFFLLLLSVPLWSEPLDPLAVSSKVQSDLENLLSRLIPPEKFLVQVNTDISTRSERRLVEGDEFIAQPEKKPRVVDPMPGFVPETSELETEAVAPPLRRSFRLVEIPELRAVRVNVGFDQAIARETLNRAEFLVRAYVQNNYRGLGSLIFSSLPMLPSEKEAARALASEKEEAPKKEEVAKPLSESDILWNYARWGVFGILVALLLLSVRRPAPPVAQAAPRKSISPAEDFLNKASLASLFSNKSPVATPEAGKTQEDSASELRKRAVSRFISRAQAFRQYYLMLSREAADELYACISGPALNRLLSGLAITPPSESGAPSNIEEVLLNHLKDFEEYVQAKDWQDRQFFGFLQNLSNEQLATLVASQKPVAACVILRMMQPRQSAAVLDLMSAAKRHEILSQVASIAEVAFSDIVNIEREVRIAANQVPERYLGSQKDDAEFWGSVVSESNDQDPIYDELEHTRPDLAAGLRKFKFRLEEAASLPDSLLHKVLGGVDNEELCLALSTCTADVREVLLDALSPSRRNVLINLFPTYRGAPPSKAQPARAKLTKRIREALT